MSKLPDQYLGIGRRFKKYFSALSALGKAARAAGPLDEKTSQLIQLAGAAVARSEGALHSHARRAIEAGATVEELHHTILLLTSTIGFPAVSAALSWLDDVLAMQTGRAKKDRGNYIAPDIVVRHTLIKQKQDGEKQKKNVRA